MMKPNCIPLSMGLLRHNSRLDGRSYPSIITMKSRIWMNTWTHLSHKWAMNDDTIMWWVFPTTIKVQCFIGLLTCQETSSTHLWPSKRVSDQYHLIAMTLANIRQDEDGYIHNFMLRFSSISIWIQDLSPEVALTSMIMTLKSRPFLKNLCKKL